MLLVHTLRLLHLLHHHCLLLNDLVLILDGDFGCILICVHLFGHFFVGLIFCVNILLLLDTAHAILIASAHISCELGELILDSDLLRPTLESIGEHLLGFGRLSHSSY